MDTFDINGHPSGFDLDPQLDGTAALTPDGLAHHGCLQDLTQALALAHIAQGMDPTAAVLQAQLDAPLIQPFLH